MAATIPGLSLPFFAIRDRFRTDLLKGLDSNPGRIRTTSIPSRDARHRAGPVSRHHLIFRLRVHHFPDRLSVLNSVFGLPGFRGAQEEVVRHVTDGGNCLVLMPTGGGKSLCYQLPSLLREGCGIVVSPLIALMRDQVRACSTPASRRPC